MRDDAGRSVYLQTVEYPDFERTVETPIHLDEYDAAPTAFTGVASEAGVRCWGVRAGAQNQDYYDSMDAQDLVLFYSSKRYVGVGYIDAKVHDEAGWIAEQFWEDAPSTHMYTITEFSPLDIPHAAVHTIFGYSANWYPQGLMRVKEDRVTNSIQAIKLAVERYHHRHH